jgi:hypothetical protein
LRRATVGSTWAISHVPSSVVTSPGVYPHRARCYTPVAFSCATCSDLHLSDYHLV